MIQIILLILLLIAIALGTYQDYLSWKLLQALDEFYDELETRNMMYDDLARFDSLEELTAAQNAKYVDDGSLFDIEL